MSTPSPVRWSAVMPVFLRLAPTGRRRASAWVRNRPSNMVLLRAVCLLKLAADPMDRRHRALPTPRLVTLFPHRPVEHRAAPARLGSTVGTLAGPATEPVAPARRCHAVLPTGEDPQRRPGGPRRLGEDHAGRGAAARRRGHHPDRAGRGRHHRQRLRPRGAAPGHLAVARGGARSSGRATRST